MDFDVDSPGHAPSFVSVLTDVGPAEVLDWERSFWPVCWRLSMLVIPLRAHFEGVGLSPGGESCTTALERLCELSIPAFAAKALRDRYSWLTSNCQHCGTHGLPEFERSFCSLKLYLPRLGTRLGRGTRLRNGEDTPPGATEKLPVSSILGDRQSGTFYFRSRLGMCA
jgi:hypothetical protein